MRFANAFAVSHFAVLIIGYARRRRSTSLLVQLDFDTERMRERRETASSLSLAGSLGRQPQ